MKLDSKPDPRINIRIVRKVRDLAVLVLLDLSESTNEKLGGSDKPVIQLAREATSLLSWAIDRVGDPFAIPRISVRSNPILSRTSLICW